MSILETTTKNHAVPKFSIYNDFPQMGVVESLKHCFIERFEISTHNPPANICASNGEVYQAVYDSRLPPGKDNVLVIASFQKHTYGRFAVIRHVKEDRK